MADPGVNQMFGLIAELGIATGEAPLKGKTWIFEVDDQWILAINGKSEDCELKPKGTMGCNVPPVHAAIFYNGWLAGLLNPFDGALAAGEGANEATLIEALKAKLADIIKEK